MTDNVPATTSQGSVAAYTGGSGNPFLDAAEDMGANSGALFLKFDGNTGRFTYGRDEEELPKGTRVAIAASEFKRGWICWKDSTVMGEVMRRIQDGPRVEKSTLEDHGPYEDEKDGWREQSSIEFRDIETGEQFLYKASSKGGTISVANLIRDYGKSFQMHPGELAIVELQNTSFEAKDKNGKKLGKKYAPVFKIVAWQNEAELIASFENAGSEDAEVEDEIPVNTAGKAGAGRRNRSF